GDAEHRRHGAPNLRRGLHSRQAFANVPPMNPVLALALLASAGVLVTRLPRFPAPRSPTLDLVQAGGAPLVLLGVVLGPGIAVLDGPTLAALAPVTAPAVGWMGHRLDATWEWA